MNEIKIQTDNKIQGFEPTKFDIEDSNHLIVTIINVPKGKIEINSSFCLVNDKGEKGEPIRLSHTLFTGSEDAVLRGLLLAGANTLIKGKEKNESKIII